MNLPDDDPLLLLLLLLLLLKLLLLQLLLPFGGITFSGDLKITNYKHRIFLFFNIKN